MSLTAPLSLLISPVVVLLLFPLVSPQAARCHGPLSLDLLGVEGLGRLD